MRLVGIDPGLQRTGYACVELPTRGLEPRLVEAGVIRLRASASTPSRLLQLHRELSELLEEFKPVRVTVESVFSQARFARAAIVMGHARGVVVLAAMQQGIEVSELAPAEVKRAVAGRGNASKDQVRRAVMAQCGLRSMRGPSDVSDAIAIALCAARRMGALR
ncbi:MAG: crossover junction endodeoxyribonuclease RuvC [Planctomycetes bacterium]|nr:crossover junction endodeoxyribonuclease RuvC [Planctomycetota bacterium]